LQVIHHVARCAVDVMGFQIMYFPFDSLRLVAAFCTSVVVTLEGKFALLEVDKAILPSYPL
jgi:hypothetical protein